MGLVSARSSHSITSSARASSAQIVYTSPSLARFAGAGAVAAKDLAFFIRGPMDGPLSRGRLKFFREAPRLGLTGITFITIGEHGVIAESVAYDLNLALAVHQRRAPTEQL